MLQHLIPRRRLAEMCLTGEPLTAAAGTGIRPGQLRGRRSWTPSCDWLLQRVLDKSPAAIRRGLYTMKKIEAMAFEESMSFTESQIALFTLTEDAREGQQAFQQKRKPQWTGR